MTAATRSTSALRPLRHPAVLAVVSIVILLLFAADVGTLVNLWWTSTTFGHCLFIGPVIAWLIWQRRAELAQVTPVAWWPGLSVVALGGLCWLIGEAGQVAFARQFGLLIMLQGSVVSLLGPNVARALLLPLAYAVFLVPFGDWLEPPLQAITVALVMPMLHLVGVSAVVDGVLIHAGRYWFEVAEACSGAKFVIAMLAFGMLVANVCFWSWRRRAAFMVVAIVVPVLANSVRAFATIWAANLTSVEAATGFDHIIYGWLFFGLVMAVVLAIGWRWFDRAPDDPAFDAARFQAVPRQRSDLLVTALLVLATAALFPAWSGLIDQRATALPDRIALPPVAGWTRVPPDRAAAWRPSYPGADHELFGRYRDRSGETVDLAMAAFAEQGEGKEMVGYGRGVLREEDRWIRVADLPPVAGGSAMRIVTTGPDGRSVERVVATWYRIGGILTHDERRVKVETMRVKLLGGRQTAVALHLSVVTRPNRDPVSIIDRFVRDAGPLDRMADDIVGHR